jgi:hypothetical protein
LKKRNESICYYFAIYCNIANDSNQSNLYITGALVTTSLISASFGLPKESLWKYPEWYVSSFYNFLSPFDKYNPLLDVDYNTKLDYIRLTGYKFVYIEDKKCNIKNM